MKTFASIFICWTKKYSSYVAQKLFPGESNFTNFFWNIFSHLCSCLGNYKQAYKQTQVLLALRYQIFFVHGLSLDTSTLRRHGVEIIIIHVVFVAWIKVLMIGETSLRNLMIMLTIRLFNWHMMFIREVHHSVLLNQSIDTTWADLVKDSLSTFQS